ncbi:MAG TPA: ATP-dependent DNA helicase, partial [Actinotalea sp.]|nr:ATP-dependent DNA helicase [Actinotalea sp.]
RASARLLKAVAGDGKRLWVVGDTRQSIYRFRGASSSNMAAFTSEYPDAKVDQLEVNYRSSKEVVDAFVSVAPRMGASEGMLPLRLTAHRGPSGGRPEIRLFDSPDDELAGIAAGIEELRAAGVPLREQAVLCRGNSRLNDVAAALEARGIPTLYLGSLFERDEIRDLLSLLSLVVDPFCDGLVRVGAMPRYALTLQDVHAASAFLRDRRLPALDGLRALADADATLSERGRAGLRRLVGDLGGLTIASSGWDVLATYLLDKTDAAKQLGKCASAADRMRAIAVWQLLNFIREQSPTGSGLSVRRALERIRQLVLLSEERDLRKMPDAALELNAVRLMTVHASKGLEFEGVHIASLTVASFPLAHRAAQCPPPAGLVSGAGGLTVAEEAARSHAHEEECLFFVAASRARTHLRMYRSTRMANGNNRGASPFLDWFGSGLVGTASAPPRLPAPPASGPRDTIAVVRASPLNVSDSRLGSYEKCPRRFFYTTVLGLGGGRKVTAFSQTHDCLFDLIKWLATARPGTEPTLAQTEAAFDVIWKDRGPVAHGYAGEYRLLASRL